MKLIKNIVFAQVSRFRVTRTISIQAILLSAFVATSMAPVQTSDAADGYVHHSNERHGNGRHGNGRHGNGRHGNGRHGYGRPIKSMPDVGYVIDENSCATTITSNKKIRSISIWAGDGTILKEWYRLGGQEFDIPAEYLAFLTDGATVYVQSRGAGIALTNEFTDEIEACLAPPPVTCVCEPVT